MNHAQKIDLRMIAASTGVLRDLRPEDRNCAEREEPAAKARAPCPVARRSASYCCRLILYLLDDATRRSIHSFHVAESREEVRHFQAVPLQFALLTSGNASVGGRLFDGVVHLIRSVYLRRVTDHFKRFSYFCLGYRRLHGLRRQAVETVEGVTNYDNGAPRFFR